MSNLSNRQYVKRSKLFGAPEYYSLAPKTIAKSRIPLSKDEYQELCEYLKHKSLVFVDENLQEQQIES